jgi:hypothetical protein
MPSGVLGIEDIVPPSIAILAATAYCREFAPDAVAASEAVTLERLLSITEQADLGLLKRLELTIGQAVETKTPDFHLDKIGFARAVVSLLQRGVPDGSVNEAEITEFHANLRTLLQVLSKVTRSAERDQVSGQISAYIKRVRRDFLRVHINAARKEEVSSLLEDIEAQLDDSPEADMTRVDIAAITRDFDLENNPRDAIVEHSGLITRLDRLAYRPKDGASEDE